MLGVIPPEPTRPTALQRVPLWGWPFIAGVALVMSVRLYKALSSNGSLSSLRARGISYDDGQGIDDEFYAKNIKRAKKVQWEGLTEEQIMAARERRKMELQAEVVDLNNIDIPEDHPFLTKEVVTDDEKAAIKERLKNQAQRIRDRSSVSPKTPPPM